MPQKWAREAVQAYYVTRRDTPPPFSSAATCVQVVTLSYLCPWPAVLSRRNQETSKFRGTVRCWAQIREDLRWTFGYLLPDVMPNQSSLGQVRKNGEAILGRKERMPPRRARRPDFEDILGTPHSNGGNGSWPHFSRRVYRLASLVKRRFLLLVAEGSSRDRFFGWTRFRGIVAWRRLEREILVARPLFESRITYERWLKGDGKNE